MTPGTRYLAIYLNDHLAAAAGGVALVRRIRGSNPDPPAGPVLDELIEELVLDKRLLESMMAAHGIGRVRVKQAGALVAERLARLKLNGAVLSTSPLSPLVEFEGLRVAVFHKQALWETALALDLAHNRDAVEAALARAKSQLERIEPLRREAAEVALVGDETGRTAQP